MANNPKLSVARRNAALDTIFDVLNGGYVDLYDGTQPATTETSISGPVKLARNSLNATFAAAASSATKTANAIASSTALATGTATWATFVTSGGDARPGCQCGHVVCGRDHGIGRHPAGRDGLLFVVRRHDGGRLK